MNKGNGWKTNGQGDENLTQGVWSGDLVSTCYMINGKVASCSLLSSSSLLSLFLFVMLRYLVNTRGISKLLSHARYYPSSLSPNPTKPTNHTVSIYQKPSSYPVLVPRSASILYEPEGAPGVARKPPIRQEVLAFCAAAPAKQRVPGLVSSSKGPGPISPLWPE